MGKRHIPPLLFQDESWKEGRGREGRMGVSSKRVSVYGLWKSREGRKPCWPRGRRKEAPLVLIQQEGRKNCWGENSCSFGWRRIILIDDDLVRICTYVVEIRSYGDAHERAQATTNNAFFFGRQRKWWWRGRGEGKEKDDDVLASFSPLQFLPLDLFFWP